MCIVLTIERTQSMKHIIIILSFSQLSTFAEGVSFLSVLRIPSPTTGHMTSLGTSTLTTTATLMWILKSTLSLILLEIIFKRLRLNFHRAGQ